MKFGDALEHLRNGLSIRRANYHPSVYYKVEFSPDLCNGSRLDMFVDKNKFSATHITYYDMLYDDWEIYKEGNLND